MYELEFKEEEIRIILNSLDFYSRIWIGQYREIMMDLRWYRNYKQLDDLDETLRRKFWKMRVILLPKLRHYDLSASHVLNGRSLPTLDNIYALSELFKVSIDQIICGNRKYQPEHDGMHHRLKVYREYFVRLSAV